MGASLILLAAALLASIALGIATAFGLYRWTKRRWVWVLTPALILLWLAVGVLPLLFFARASIAPAPPVGPVEIAPAAGDAGAI